MNRSVDVDGDYRDRALLTRRGLTVTGAIASVAVSGMVMAVTASASANKAASPSAPAPSPSVQSGLPPLTPAQLAALEFALPPIRSPHAAPARPMALGQVAAPRRASAAPAPPAATTGAS